MIKIKICGLRFPDDVTTVNQYKPDYIGFVFAKSKRQILPAKARELKAQLHPAIQSVGVFVNEPVEGICALAGDNTIDIIQLHGDETNEYIRLLKKETGKPIIKAVRLRTAENIRQVNGMDCEYFLFDAYSPAIYGGTGQVFNWDLLQGHQIEKPYFLAGGIGSHNIREALEVTPAPYCLDVSSSLETGGKKDPRKIQALMEAYQEAKNRGRQE